MAKCERCGTGGFDMRVMHADEKKQFVGPCCVKVNADINAAFSNDLEYGLEFSSHMGLRAYASYGGLSIEFKKTQEELRKWTETSTQEQEAPSQVEATRSPESSMAN